MSPHSAKNTQDTSTLPVIAVTSGDPAGIGPEITARLFARIKPGKSIPLIVGSPTAFGPWLQRAGLKAGDYEFVIDPAEAVLKARESSRLIVLDTGETSEFTVGEDSAGGGSHAGKAIKHACQLVNNLSVQGIVTAPISKKSLNLANFRFAGHTEMLARYLNAPDCQMMMVRGYLRVVPLTRHIPLDEVSGHITQESILTCVRVVSEALVNDFNVPAPRIAVAGLNPHASDQGVIGNEEAETIVPALARLREDGVDIAGPVPADALFPQAYRDFVDRPDERGTYDAYIAIYHDQGLAPFKMMAQRRGVNVTVGLPAVRCSVDHGVAYDITGRGTGETESLFEAYKLAEEMCCNRPDRAGGHNH